MEREGYILFVLNAHIPYVRRFGKDKGFGEDLWFYEIISETYLPMLRALERLRNDSIPFKITLSISPVLVEMLTDEDLRTGYIEYAEGRIQLAEKEVSRTSSDEEVNALAKYYYERFRLDLEDYNKYKGNLLVPIKGLEKEGVLNIITTAITHSFLPTLSVTREGVANQIALAVNHFRDVFDRKPRGFWLPECGFYNGVEYYLESNDLGYSFLDTHGILFANRKPKYGVYAPVRSRNGVVFFARDAISAREVISPEDGYFSDPSYRDFYKDIGFDLPSDYIAKGMGVKSFRGYTGIKYYSKGKRGSVYYDPVAARGKAEEHAENFVYKKTKQIKRLNELMDRNPLVVFLCDAEFFGHWWYEGVIWFESVIRKIGKDTNGRGNIKMVTPEEYLEEYPLNQVVEPSFSSWGRGGYADIWLSKSNDWVYRHIHKVTERMKELIRNRSPHSKLERRALNQAVREMLLAQSSDWISMAESGLNPAYGVNRIKEHLYNFNKLYSSVLSGNINENWLASIERKNSLFKNIEYSLL